MLLESPFAGSRTAKSPLSVAAPLHDGRWTLTNELHKHAAPVLDSKAGREGNDQARRWSRKLNRNVGQLAAESEFFAVMFG